MFTKSEIKLMRETITAFFAEAQATDVASSMLIDELLARFDLKMLSVKEAIESGTFHLSHTEHEAAIRTLVDHSFMNQKAHALGHLQESVIVPFLLVWQKLGIHRLFVEIYGPNLDGVERGIENAGSTRHLYHFPSIGKSVRRRVVCSAILYASGTLLVGPRHYDCIMSAQATDSSNRNKGVYVQGFIDQFGTFMDRFEALKVAESMDQLKGVKCPPEDRLFSEDLY